MLLTTNLRHLRRQSAPPTPPPPPPPEEGVTNPFPTDWSGPVIDVPASLPSKYANKGNAANTLFDARGSEIEWTFPGITSEERTDNLADVTSDNNGINWYGGFIFYDVPINLSYQDHYHPPGNATKNSHGLRTGNEHLTGIALTGQNHRVTAARMDNCWDGLSHGRGGHNFHIRGCYATHIHDDWIENDTFCSGLIEDCLVDGAYYFYSSKSGSSTWMAPATPAQQTVTIQNCIVRIKAFPVDPGVTTPQGGGGLFKLHGGFTSETPGTHTKLRILNNWFLVECIRYIEFAGASENIKLGFPAGSGSNIITACSGNHLVWVPPSGAPATFPGVVPSSGVTVYNGAGNRPLWEAQRDAWLASHQEVDQRASVSGT